MSEPLYKQTPIEKQWIVIVNPVANSWVVSMKWEEVEQALKEQGFDFIVKVTEKKRDATNFVLDATEKGYTKFMSVGGDGTMNEVVNGILKQTQISTKDILFTHIPMGSMNDWAKIHKIPFDFKDWIPMMKGGRVVQQDLGRVEYFYKGIKQDWYFASMAGVGYSASVAAKMEEEEDKVMNKRFRAYTDLARLFTFKKEELKITHDRTKEFKGKFLTINIGIGRTINHIPLTPHAIYNDGFLAISHDTGNVSALDVARLLRKAWSPKPFEDRKIIYDKVKDFHVEPLSEKISYVQVDGELIGEIPARFLAVHNAINVLVPAK